jgi:hypothetical protein
LSEKVCGSPKASTTTERGIMRGYSPDVRADRQDGGGDLGGVMPEP